MLHGEAERHPAAERVAERVGLLHAQPVEQDRHVVADVHEADPPAAERRTAMPLEVDRDHLPSLRQHREHRPEHADRSESAVQKQKRLAAPMLLVVVADPVGLDAAITMSS
jgi:hypothetical protein